MLVHQRSLVAAKSRLQFRRDVCQSLYSPKGKRGRFLEKSAAFETRVRSARAVPLDESIEG